MEQESPQYIQTLGKARKWSCQSPLGSSGRRSGSPWWPNFSMGRSHGQAHGQQFIRRGEYDAVWGGKKQVIERGDVPIPFDHCLLSLMPFQDPVCAPDGSVFDITNIFAWLKKYKVNPVTGDKMTAKDVLVLNMHRNSKGKWSCPVTFDEFTDGSHIVAIKTTGNVYSYEAIRRLNIETKDWKEPTTGELYDKADIIHLRDPAHLENKIARNFYHVVNQLDARPESESEDSKKMNLDTTTADIIKTARASSSSPAVSTSPAPTNVSKEAPKPATVGSFTATNVEYKTALPQQVVEKKTSKKGRVQLVTNFGTLDLTLHCDLCPKTCENFLLLIDRGYYDGVVFHRLIKNFMVQGGDPEGSGRGGESAWGAPFGDEIVSSLKHDGRGVLSMANKGPNSNGSQFFILFKSAPHLDGKHTVFGRLSQESLNVLKSIENVDTDLESRPKEPIRIIKAGIIENPLDTHAMEQEKAAFLAEKAKKEQAAKDKKERGLWYSNPSAMTASSSSSTTVGRYISAASLPAPTTGSADKKRALNLEGAVPAPAAKKMKKANGDAWSVF